MLISAGACSGWSLWSSYVTVSAWKLHGWCSSGQLGECSQGIQERASANDMNNGVEERDRSFGVMKTHVITSPI